MKINKKLLEQFIAKATINGTIEGIRLISSDQTGLSTSVANLDKSAYAFITSEKLKLGDMECALGNINLLKSILNTLGDEFDFNIEIQNSLPFAFIFKDGSTEAKLVLANPRSIPLVPKLKTVIKPAITFNINKEFIKLFNKSISAINTIEYFHILTTDTQTAKIVFGYNANHPTTNVSITPDSQINHILVDPIAFGMEHISNALQANKELINGKLNIDDRGIAELICTSDGFDTIKYYFMRKTNV